MKDRKEGKVESRRNKQTTGHVQLPWRLPGAVHSLPEYHHGDIDSINVYSSEQLKIWDIIEL